MDLLRCYEAHLKFFNIDDEDEIFNMLVIRDEILNEKLNEEEKIKFNNLENKFKKISSQIKEKYPIMYKAFVENEKINPQGVFWRIDKTKL